MMSKLAPIPGQLLVGLSGGADSVALLHLLLDAGCQVAAVHVNHGLRGDASDGDEAFVRSLCEQCAVPLRVYRAIPPENPGEGWAREVRYGFFRQAMAELHADHLVLAHHQDDQAETLLLHLIRGAGLNGLTGMQPETLMEGMPILRPLLGISRAELRGYLKAKGIRWREDGTNADPRYLRNALRLEVLPILERLAPGASARMAQTAALLAQEEKTLQSLTASFLADHHGLALPLEALGDKPLGLQRRILRTWWMAQGPVSAERGLSAAQTESLLALINAPAASRCNLPGGWHGLRGWSHVHLVAPGVTEQIPEMPVAECPLLRVQSFAGETGDGVSSQTIPAEWLAQCTVRSRRRGDFIRPFGGVGKQSLQDYFTNRRIDAAFRDRVPLLCRGSEVLLAGGVGAGQVPRTKEMNDPVLLVWKETFPWQRKV